MAPVVGFLVLPVVVLGVAGYEWWAGAPTDPERLVGQLAVGVLGVVMTWLARRRYRAWLVAGHGDGEGAAE